MKFYICLVGIAFSLICFPVKAQKRCETYRGAVYVKQQTAEIQGDSVVLDMDVCVLGIPVGTYQTLVLEPVLYCESDSLVLPSVVLNGGNKDKMYKRKRVFGRKEKNDPHVMVVLKNERSHAQVVAYKDTIPFSAWMESAGMVLRGTFRNYDDKPVRMYRTVLTEDLILSK